ncbi:Hypothetical protein PROPAUS_2285 [Propionibacterium australiense]|uniref:Uncharacterized protein n=1 Tax=Propionibacterium australiense TaxID=119981 RepID=A0A383S8G1_9ACTN|nr:Hypothetical protein PROPAUS_2285 [Propionibacterium australiense]
MRQRPAHVHALRQHRRQVHTGLHERTQENLNSPRRQPVSNTHAIRRNGLRTKSSPACITINSLIIIFRYMPITQRRQRLFNRGRHTYLVPLLEGFTIFMQITILARLANHDPLVVGHGIHQFNERLDLAAPPTIFLPWFADAFTSHDSSPRSLIARRVAIVATGQRVAYVHALGQHRRQVQTGLHERAQDHLNSPRRQLVSDTHDIRRNRLGVTNPTTGIPANNLIIILGLVTITQRRQRLYNSGGNAYLLALLKSSHVFIKNVILLRLANSNPLVVGHGIHQPNKGFNLAAASAVLLP